MSDNHYGKRACFIELIVMQQHAHAVAVKARDIDIFGEMHLEAESARTRKKRMYAEVVRAKGTCRVIHRTTHREVTYRLTDNGDSVTKVGDVGDHITNDGGTEQRTQKEVG